MKKYLSALKNEDSPVGDLAFDLLRDPTYPHVKFTRRNIKRHVLSRTSDTLVLAAMEELFRRYRRRNLPAHPLRA
jgi:hypothetical protein